MFEDPSERVDEMNRNQWTKSVGIRTRRVQRYRLWEARLVRPTRLCDLLPLTLRKPAERRDRLERRWLMNDGASYLANTGFEGPRGGIGPVGLAVRAIVCGPKRGGVGAPRLPCQDYG